MVIYRDAGVVEQSGIRLPKFFRLPQRPFLGGNHLGACARVVAQQIAARSMPQCSGSEIGIHGISGFRLARKVRQGFTAISKRFQSSCVHSCEEVKNCNSTDRFSMRNRRSCFGRFRCSENSLCVMLSGLSFSNEPLHPKLHSPR